MEVTSHHLCHILLVKSKSQALPTCPGMELNKGMNTTRQGQLEVTLESVCPRSPKQKEVIQDYRVVNFLAYLRVFIRTDTLNLGNLCNNIRKGIIMLTMPDMW